MLLRPGLILCSTVRLWAVKLEFSIYRAWILLRREGSVLASANNYRNRRKSGLDVWVLGSI